MTPAPTLKSRSCSPPKTSLPILCCSIGSLWQEWKQRFFDYHHDLPPAAAAQILGGNVVYSETRNGQWIGVIEMERIVDAKN